MIQTIYLSIISIPVLYIFFVFTKKFWVKVFFNINICPFCMAVGATWLWMLIARSLNLLEIDEIVLAILLGHTIIGLLWKFENYYKSKGYEKWYIIRLVYIVSAQLVVYYIVTLDPNFRIGFIVGVIGLFLTSYLFFSFSKMGLKKFWNDITRKETDESESKDVSGNRVGGQDTKDDSSKKATINKKKDSKTDDEKALEKMDKMFEECC